MWLGSAGFTQNAWEWSCWGKGIFQRRNTQMHFLVMVLRIHTLLWNWHTVSCLNLNLEFSFTLFRLTFSAAHSSRMQYLSLSFIGVLTDYGVDKYDIGTGFGHFGIAVEDVSLSWAHWIATIVVLPSCLPTHSMLSVCAQVQKVVDIVKAKGGKVSREPGPVKGGKSIIAFVEDPDGYKFELIQRGPTPEPFCQVMLRVGDLERAVTFYEKVCLNIWQVLVIAMHKFKFGLYFGFYCLQSCSAPDKSILVCVFWVRPLGWSCWGWGIILNRRYVLWSLEWLTSLTCCNPALPVPLQAGCFNSRESI